MSDDKPPASPGGGIARRPPSALELAVLLVAGLVAMLVFATLGWGGLAVIVAVYALAGAVLLAWSRWPRPPRSAGSRGRS